MVNLIKTYKQTRDMSCGPSCILMILDYFRPGVIDMNIINEHKIHDKICSRELGGYTLPSSICHFLLDRRIVVKYQLFKAPGSHPLIDACLETDRVLRSGLEGFFEEKYFDSKAIINELKKGRFVLLPINAGDEEYVALHWILLIGYQGIFSKRFIYADPADGKLKFMSESRLNKHLSYSYVRLFISAWR